MKLSLVVLGALVVSTAAFASDGTANFRIENGAVVSFSYDADFHAGKLTGQITTNGTSQVELSVNRAGDWTGHMGTVSVNASAVSTDDAGMQTVEIRTMDGIFDYTIETNAKGDVEFRTMSPQTGELLTAGLTDKGTQFSVLTRNLNMGLSLDPDTNCACHFSGPATAFYGTETADLNAMGSLSLLDLARKDPALFVLLYVLPFDLGN